MAPIMAIGWLSQAPRDEVGSVVVLCGWRNEPGGALSGWGHDDQVRVKQLREYVVLLVSHELHMA